jgi:S-adenosylmethionine uptake transporter
MKSGVFKIFSASGESAGPDVEKGMLAMTLAMLMVPGMDAIAKALSDTVPAAQVAWSRFLFQSAIMLPILLIWRRDVLKTRMQIGPQALRGALMATAATCFFWSLKYLPLADAIAIFFVEPLILTLFSALFLGEPIGWRRISAVTVGFLGALIVIRPSWEIFGWPALLPLAAACCFAGYLTLTRYLAPKHSAVGMQLWAGVFGALVLTVVLGVGAVVEAPAADPVWPTAREWGLLAVMGVFGTLAHIMVVYAFRQAAAGVLAPFQYLEIISATLLGLLIFGDFPDAVTWLGTAVIVGSGLYVYHRERRLARKLRRIPVPPVNRPG